MGQFTILMNNSTKGLTVTNRIKLHQHESLMDKLVFIIEFNYADGIDLSEFNVEFRWRDATNVAHVDMLEKEEDIYKEKYQRYFLPITSPLNRFVGNNEGYLEFTKVDYENNKRYRLTTEPVIIPICSIPDYFEVIPNESFDAINDAINELKAQSDALVASAALYEKIKADNIGINEDGSVQLKSNGDFIGDAINVAIVEEPDDDDEYQDGVIDISGKYEDVVL